MREGLLFGLIVGFGIATINYFTLRNNPNFDFLKFLLTSFITGVLIGITWGLFIRWQNKRKG